MIDPQVVMLAGIAVLVGAVIQGAVGMGVGLVAAPIVTLLDPSLMPGSLLVAGFFMPAMSLATEHRHVDPRVGWVFLGRVAGTLPGVLVVAALPPEQLAVAVGLMTLLAVALTLHTYVLPVTRSTLVGAGFFSAVGATTASIGGPPLGLVYQRSDPRTLRSTTALVFVVGSALSMGALALAGEMSLRELLTGLAFFPFFGVGFALSLRLRRRLRGPAFRYAVLAVITASALAVLVRAAVT
ncbi:MAG: sulfite exporter TauE/SafE family protein [Actinomycetota bacterium]|nr:sulfite exporter TauE/SafE family protein [Actinomycetota bacterium]